MKHRIITAIAFALVAAMAFTACGNNPEPAGAASSTSVAEVSEASSSQPPSEPSSASEPADTQAESATEAEDGEAGGDIAAYAAEMQEMLDALSSLYGDALTIETSTEGSDTLIITYTLITDELGLNAENIAESMESEGAKMEDLAAQMEAGGIASPVIVVKWIDTDGSELFHKEYK